MDVLTLPDLGEGLQQAEVVSWQVSVGDHVVTNQPLLSVETDKAVVEVPSPRSGTIAKLCAEVGDIVAVGAPLVEFDSSERSDSGTVVGNLETAPEAPAPITAPTPAAEISATPRVRALARELGVELNSVRGSGPGGAILSSDVEQAVPAGGHATESQILRGVRRAMADRMIKAHAEVVPASIHEDADVDAWPPHTDTTLRLVTAIAHACKVEPALNAWYDNATMSRRLHDHIDLGLAVDTEDGLFVPVLRNIGERDAASLRAGMERMKADVIARSIPPDQLRGQTLTLSNFGSIGGRYAELVVVPPQVAIIGAGRIRPEPVAVDDEVTVRRRLPLSLSFDHRCVTGAEAARFLSAIIEKLQEP